MVKIVKRGFTLIEVGLFLAVTGVLFVGITMGVQGSIFQQRFNDSVQSFAEFLKSAYSQTSNVENNGLTGGGQSDKAIYGKLITFGEEYNLEGKENIDKTIFSYTVIGNADGDIGSGNVLKELWKLEASVFAETEVDGKKTIEFASIVGQYFPRWGAGIQTTKGSPYENFKGAVLIVRHPSSGTVFTYYSKDVIEVNEMKKEASLLPKLFDEEEKKIQDMFLIEDVDFCVNPEPELEGMVARRDVRIVMGARNASGVEVIGQNDETPGSGNRCAE